jgi:DNA-binding transcriptional ArsR family regulator
MDVDEEIERILSVGAKTPKELKKAVIGVTGVSERVYYRHLKGLFEKKLVEEVSEKDSTGRLIRKYALKEASSEGILPRWHPSVTEFSKGLWELVAWIRHSPGGWSRDDEDVKKAYAVIPLYESSFDFPEVKRYHLDPDRYVIEWPIVFKRDLKIGCALPRFFSLKSIYQATLIGAVDKPDFRDAPSFLGVKDFVDADGVNRRIAVVVRRRSDGKLQVCHVESSAHFSRQWIDAFSKECDVSGLKMFFSGDKALMRNAVFHLDRVFKEGRLLIPSKYSLLLKDLCLFNFRYTPPPEPRGLDEKRMLQDYVETGGNFVHTLAAAVSCADEMKIK